MTTTRAPRSDCGHPRPARTLPGWAHGWAYAGCAIPALGLIAADTFWVLGMPIAVLAGGVRATWQAPGPVFAVAVVVLPVLGGLLMPAAALRWTTARWTAIRWTAIRSGPVPPHRLPAGPARLLILFATGTFAAAVAVYALAGAALVLRDLASATTWSELRAGWAVTGTVVMVVAWVVSLGVVALGCRLAGRPDCELCELGPAGVKAAPHRAPGRG